MLGWFKRRRKGVPCQALAKTRLTQIRDTKGFDHGVIVDEQRHQVTLIAEVTDGDPEHWDSFVNHMLADEALACLTKVTTANSTLVAATFTATEKTEKKDSEQFLTSRAVQAEEIMSAGRAAGWTLEPCDRAAVRAWIDSVWPSPENTSAWPPTTGELTETDKILTVSSESTAAVTAVFETDVNGDPALTKTLDEIAATTDGSVRFAHLVRPALRELDEGNAIGQETGLVTIVSETAEDVAADADAFITVLDPHSRLRCHRMVGRQQVGLLAGAGAGTLPWQHLTLTGKAAA